MTRVSRSAVALTALVLLASPLAASATEFAVKVEPGVTIPLSAPQSDIYDTGGGQTVKALFGINSYIDIGPAATFQFLPAEAANAQSGVVQGFGASLRVKRPHDRDTYYGISPWFDADAMYVRTGDLNRPGLAAAVGLSVPLGKQRLYWVGPFVRYTQVVQTPSRSGYDNRDAKLLSLGISFELGSGLKLPKAPDRVADSSPATAPVAAETVSCPDRDKDTIPDDIDHCPEVKGPMDSFGCPPYKKVVVANHQWDFETGACGMATIDLLTSSRFAVLANQSVDNTGLTEITGDVGTDPGTSITGFGPGIIDGAQFAGGPIPLQGITDLTTAYNDAAGRSLCSIAKSGNIGGQTLAPGLYTSAIDLAVSSGDLTLDAQGDPDGVWIFQAGSTLDLTSGRQVILTNGAKASNIFWQVGSSATLGSTVVFHGTIMAEASVTMVTGASLNGRALARTASVTLDDNTIVLPAP